MTALTITGETTPLPNATDFDAWLDEGRRYADEHRNLGFRIGDWLNRGREQFPEQIELALDHRILELLGLPSLFLGLFEHFKLFWLRQLG